MAISKFGKYVELRVKDKSGVEIFSSVSEARSASEVGSPYLDRLRVDFDMRLVPRHGRLKVDVYNLSNETIKSLVEGEDLTMEVWVGLHGETPVLLGHSMYVSNVLSAIKVPNVVTSLFGFTELKRKILETQMSDSGFIKKGATFEETVNSLVNLASKKTGIGSTAVKFLFVPDAIKKVIIAKQRPLNGSLESLLDAITKQHSCYYYVDGSDVTIVYIASVPNTTESKPLEDATGQIQIDPSNFRSNPKVSLGNMTLDINLEPNIDPTNVIDTTNFITAEFSIDPLILAYSNGVISSAGPSPKMIALYVDHKGSTHTKGWNTAITAYGPTVGNSAKVSAQHWAD